MGRPAGLAKTGGRQKGTPNRRTFELETALQNAGVDVVAELAETLAALTPEAKARILVELLSYLYPKRKALEFVREESEDEMAPTI